MVLSGHHNPIILQFALPQWGQRRTWPFMTDDLIREIATKAFCDALQARAQQLAEDVARRMKAALQPDAEPRERTKALHDGAVLIAGSRTQTETLEALLAASSAITPGCGLLILRGAVAGGWSCQGLTTLDNFKRATMDCSRGIAAAVIRSSNGAEAQASELDQVFVARLGLDASARIVLLPVLLKERVAALLLALAPEGDELTAIDVLVQVAQLALDLQAYRKTALKSAVESASAAVQKVPVAVAEPARGAVVPAMPKSEEEHAAVEQQKSAMESPEPQAAPEVVSQAVEETPPEPTYEAVPPHPVVVPEPPQPEPQSAAVQEVAAAAPEIPRQQPVVAAPPEVPEAPPANVDVPVSVAAFQEPAPPAQPVPAATEVIADEAHMKARRFAKLLVEEIKLYNQTKVAEGRARGDLYSRLREDIEKSRAAYHKRYGESVRDVDYFSQELMRILADNNRTVMGAGFPG